MIRKNGGYLIIDLSSADLVEELGKAYADDKPILVYDTNGKANWFTLTKVDTDYYLTGVDTKYKITSAGVITSESVIISTHSLDILINYGDGYGQCGLVITTNNSEPITTENDLFKYGVGTNKQIYVSGYFDANSSNTNIEPIVALQKKVDGVYMLTNSLSAGIKATKLEDELQIEDSIN